MAVPGDLNSVHNPVTGGVAPAAWGDAIRDRWEFILRDKPACRAISTVPITIPDSTWTSIPFNQEDYDDGGCHSTVSNTSRFTAPTASGGKFDCGGGVSWEPHATGRRLWRLLKNGTTVIAQTELMKESVGGASSGSPATQVELAADDYVQMQVFQTCGGDLDVEVIADFSPSFWFSWNKA